jgi:hypothetical protein
MQSKQRAHLLNLRNWILFSLTVTNSSDPNFSGNMVNIFWSSLGLDTLWPTYDLFQSAN